MLVVAAVALALGCGDDDEKTETLKIGMLNPATGGLAAYAAPLEQGARLAIAHLNDAGGVLDKDLELVVRDTATDPDTAASAAEALMSDADIVGVVGAAASGSTVAASAAAVANQKVLISGASTSPDVTDLDDSGFVFRTVPSDAFQGAVLADVLHDHSHTTAAILHLDNSYGNGLKDVFTAAYTGLGHTVTTTRSYPETAAETVGYDFQADLAAVYAGTPQAIVLIAYFSDAAEFFKTWNTNGGFSGQWYVTDGAKSADLPVEVGTGVLDGVIGTAPSLFSADAFDSAYQARFGEVPGLFAANYYDATVLLGLAIAEAGSTSGTAIRDAMATVAGPPGTSVTVGGLKAGLDAIDAGTDIDFEGASGPVDFDANGDVSGPVELWHYDSSDAIVVDEVIEP
jgi:ABC-type branched-subunit amino acid transport system substrate-binding protein